MRTKHRELQVGVLASHFNGPGTASTELDLWTSVVASAVDF
ncbi:hypothetical protein [Paenarthrobacter sp. CAP02]